MRSGIDLDDIERAPFFDLVAVFAGVARLCAFPMGAVDGFGEETGKSRFAGAAWSGEKIRLTNSTEFEGVFERADYRLLADDI